jgi:hypothetical protein
MPYWTYYTLYAQIAISAIAVISCMVLIIALTIPLIIPLLREFNTQRYEAKNARQSAGSIIGTGATTRSSGRSSRTRATVSTEPAYSSYNLYLVYLAIPDLMLNLYILIIYGIYANQNPQDIEIQYELLQFDNFGDASFIACSTANLVRIFLLLFISICLLRNDLHY